jgi:hypothetical protein
LTWKQFGDFFDEFAVTLRVNRGQYYWDSEDFGGFSSAHRRSLYQRFVA